MTILIATRNRGKIREFRQMLGDHRYAWTDLSESTFAEAEETGRTFRANAILKASYYARHVGGWAMADDSGLEVDALGRKPGVQSARWAEMHASGSGDAANNTLLLDQLRAVPDDRRTARFVCVLAISDPSGGVVATCRESVEGRILRSPRGTNGFGYDPLFLIESLKMTTAELNPVQKHQVSHRGKALDLMRRRLEELNLPAIPAEVRP